MVRRSKAQWREIIREQTESGLNASAFCRVHGVSPKYFSLRRQQLSSNTAPDDTTATLSAFVPVTMSRSVDALAVEIQLGTTLSLRVPLAVSPRWLVEVLHGLQD